MKTNPIVEKYIHDLQDSVVAAAAYAAGKTIHTIAKPVLNVAGKIIKKVGSAGYNLAKKKLKDFASLKKKKRSREGPISALVKGLRGKTA